MKVLVSIKRAIDYNVHIRIADDGSGVVTDGVKHSINPFDEIALEQAIRWKEDGTADEVVAVTIGGDAAVEQLRTALAFGCDRVLHVRTDQPVSSLTAARTLAAIAAQESPDVLLLGKQAIDDDNGQTGAMTAGLLGWPQATFASAITLGDHSARVTREIDAGLETLEIDLPGLITTDLRLNEPRYLKLPNIMKAKKKPIEDTTLEALGVTPAAGHRVVDTTPPAPRPAGERVDSVDALVARLNDKGLV
ncbi:electron transfer flavoprotein subunit beta/FixA family protein [Salinisphaera sp. Q1T1-3]|uniref:electron transfer flavoprotein subunit beta/FixA family protein n=1 Tax=Salinisphaera sp. Q1T1-3 TaxID=2321229 RepID=UPI000E718FCE|nr:electron transfer flavoprotein subunit beta/FixA family protein [Salinisphaera sp. Q1T1-3]RJS95254.1 electron transfer flavoprotein subunit beta/FixA family protein [Salinisphaera sp. Q1T1-3]